MKWILIGLLASLGFASEQKTSTSVAYDCQTADEGRIVVLQEGRNRLLQIIDKAGHVKKEVRVTRYLSFFDEDRDPIDYWFSLPEVEMRSQLERKIPQYYRVAFILEGKVLKDVSCKPYELGIPIRVMISPEDFLRSDNLWLTRAARGFKTPDTLHTESVEMWQAVIKRFADLKTQMSGPKWQDLVKKTFGRVRVISKGAAQQIEKNLEADQKKCWQLILKLFDFDKLSPVDKWVWWVGLGNRGNFEAVRSAIREFFQTGLFKEPQLEEYFSSNVKDDLKKISPKQKDQIVGSGLDRREKAYFLKIWQKANL